MAFEIIKSIVEAESQAGQIKTDALAEAGAIKALANKKSGEIAALAKTNAKLEEERLVKEAIEASASRVQQILEEAKKTSADIKKSADAKHAAAVEAVIRKVVGVNGDS